MNNKYKMSFFFSCQDWIDHLISYWDCQVYLWIHSKHEHNRRLCIISITRHLLKMLRYTSPWYQTFFKNQLQIYNCICFEASYQILHMPHEYDVQPLGIWTLGPQGLDIHVLNFDLPRLGPNSNLRHLFVQLNLHIQMQWHFHSLFLRFINSHNCSLF